MKKIFLSIIIVSIIFLVSGCKGGIDENRPVEPPRDVSDVKSGPVGKDSWKYYVAGRDSKSLAINDNNQDETVFVYYLDDEVFTGTFTWETSNGKTVNAKLYFSNNSSLPTSATIYEYDKPTESYIKYNGQEYYFMGYIV